MSEKEGNDEGLEDDGEDHPNDEFANISKNQTENFDGVQLQQNTFASKNNSMFPTDEQLLPPQELQAYSLVPKGAPDLANPSYSAADYSQTLLNNGQRVTIEFEELQLFERLKKLVDCSVKM